MAWRLRFGLIAVFILVAAWAGAEIWLSGKVLPGIHIKSVDIGGLDLQAAQKKLQELNNNSKIRISEAIKGTSFEIEASQIGREVDVSATANAAFALGRQGNLLDRLQERAKAIFSKQELPLIYKLDTNKLKNELDLFAKSFAVAPQDAKIILTKNAYVLKPDQLGQKLDVDSAIEQFKAAPESKEITLKAEKIEAKVTVEKLQPLADQANKAMRPLTIIYREPAVDNAEGVLHKMELSAEKVADLFFVKASGLEVDQKTINKMAMSFKEFDKLPVDAKLVNKNGDLVVEKEQAGFSIDTEKAEKILTEAILSDVSQVEVPLKTVTAKVKAADLPDPSRFVVISEAETSFAGSSWARATNVEVAGTRLDGHVIAPGEVFSFNQAIGNIGLESGFKTALVISGGRTVEGVGGGVCQVSTTAFRAFYKAGLPVVERNQHAYRVHWYDPIVGFDAAVYQPVLDLRVKNDLETPLLIKSEVNKKRGRIKVSVLGMPVTRKVTVSDPLILSTSPAPAALYTVDNSLRPGQRRQVDWAARGYNIQLTRTITDEKGTRSDVLRTNYQPWRAVYLVGPAPAQVAPKPAPVTKPTEPTPTEPAPTPEPVSDPTGNPESTTSATIAQ